MSYVYCGWLDSALKWILNNVISPVFNCIKGVLSSVFSFIYGNVLGPILDKTIYAIGRKIWEMFLDMFFEAVYSIAKMVLQILDCLSDLFDTLLGVQPVIFKGEETTLLRAFLSMDAVRRAFWYINFFALGLAVIFAVYGVTRSMLDFDFENKRPVSRVMSSLLSSVLNLFTVQFAVFGIIYLAEAILTGLNSAMALAGGAAGNTTLGRMIFVLGTLNAANDASANLSSEAVQNGSKIIGPTDPIRNKFFESSGLNPFKLSDVKTCFNIHKLDYIILIGLGLVFSFLLLIALISVVRRLFNLLLLYIVSPLFAATIPLDDGEHFGKWRNLFVGTCFTGYGMLVAMKLYLLICPTIMGSELKMSGSVELNFVCKVVFLLGGLWAVYKSSSMITSLISAEAGSAEAESVAMGTEIGKLVGGNLWALIKSGKRPDKDKEGKEGQDGQNGKLGEGSQRFNGKNAGAAGTGDHGKDNAFQGDMRNRNDKLEGAGKKDDKNKNSNLFQGKAKPGKSGKSGADRTLDKLRKQFDMDNVGDLDQEKEAEAGSGKNKNAYQERKGRKTTDTFGLGVGKNKKSMDALRSKFRLDADAPEAADAKAETEDKKNKNDTVKANDKKSKLEGSVNAGRRGTKEDNGLFGQRPELEKPDDLQSGAFGGKGKDDSGLKTNKRPNIDTMSAAKTDSKTSPVPPVPPISPAQGGNAPVDAHNDDGKGNAFNNIKAGNNPPKKAEPNSTQNPAEPKVNAPEQNLDPTQVPKSTQGFGQQAPGQSNVQPDLHAGDTSNKFGSGQPAQTTSTSHDARGGFDDGITHMNGVPNTNLKSNQVNEPGIENDINIPGIENLETVSMGGSQAPKTQTFGQGGISAGSVSSQPQTLNPGQTGNQAYAPDKGVGSQQNNRQPGTANVDVNSSPIPNGVGMDGNYQTNGVPNSTPKTFVQGQEVPGPQKSDQGQGGFNQQPQAFEQRQDVPTGGVSMGGSNKQGPATVGGNSQINNQSQSRGATSTVYTEQMGGSSTTNVEGGAFSTNGVFSDKGQAFASNTIGGGNDILQGNGVNKLNPTGPQVNEPGTNRNINIPGVKTSASEGGTAANRGGMRRDDTDISYGEVNTNNFRRSAGIDPTFGEQGNAGGSNNTYNASNVSLNQNTLNTNNLNASTQQQMDMNNISMNQNINVQNSPAGSNVYSNISNNSSNTVNMNNNDISTNHLNSSENHSNVVDEEIQVGGRSYARDDSSFDYGNRTKAAFEQSVHFERIDNSQTQIETEMNGVKNDTQTVREESKRESDNKKKPDDKK